MTTTDDIIDRIVANVLQQLGRPVSVVPQPASAPARGSAVTEIDADVITAALLEERATGHGPLVIGAKAVLTPSAREWLAKRGQAWSRKNGNHRPAVQPSRWLAIVARSTPAVEAAIEALPKDPNPFWKRELVGCHREAAARAVDAVCRGDCDGAVALTARPETLACLANRNAMVRAAAVSNVARIRAVRQELGANVLAIDPSAASAFELRQVFKEIAAGGKPVAPEGF